MLLLALGLVAVAGTALATPKIHACPQPDGTTRFQDRPCNAPDFAAPPPQSRGAEASSGRSATPPRAATEARGNADDPTVAGPGRAGAAATMREAAEFDDWTYAPTTRAQYVALNAERCRQGHRRACAAVTCERSGDLASRDCQAAVGFHSGRGWQARPRGDVFETGREADDYVLRCATGRTRRFSLLRDGATAGRSTTVEPGGAASAAGARDSTGTAGAAGAGDVAPRVTLAALPAFASGACAAGSER